MSQPSKPDGTDPRILAPEEDEPTVTIAHGYSTGKTYHTLTCSTVKRMDEPHEVPKSVAEWKDYTKCKRCDEREGGEGYEHPGGPANGPSIGQLVAGVSAPRCLQVRARLLGGETQAAVADALDIGSATVGRHARGECSCDHYGRSLTHQRNQYTPVEEAGVPRHITGYAEIDAAACEQMRKALTTAGVTVPPLATVMGVSEDSVRHHARGECDHDHPTPPVTYADDRETWEVDA